MSEHKWAQENLDAYVAGTLSANERSRVERHLDACMECAHTKAEICDMEQIMEGIFNPVRPDVGMEDRAIRKLRQARKPRPSIMRFVTAAAAVLVLGLIGGGVQMLVSNGILPLPGMDNGPGKGGDLAQNGPFYGLIGGRAKHIKDAGPAAKQEQKEGVDIDVKSMNEEIPDANVLLGLETANKAIESTKDEKNSPPVNLPAPGGFGGGGQGGALDDNENRLRLKFQIRDQPKAPDVRFYDSATVGRDNKEKMDKDMTFFDTATRDRKPGDQLVADSLLIAKMKEQTDVAKDITKHLNKQEKALAEMPAPSLGVPPPLAGLAPAPQPGPNFYNSFRPPIPTGVSQPSNTTAGTTSGGGKGQIGSGPIPFGTPAVGSGSGSFLPMIPPPVQVPYESGKKAPSPKGDLDSGNKGEEKKPGEAAPPQTGEGGPKLPPKVQPKVEPKDPAPEKTGRMIIRTGEMEFETDSFDNSVESITKLITGVKGGFIATINSDKLANGKTKGSVIVRMPPNLLDKFIYDLRRELAKTSELKNQRLGSLDVTKQYTDIESRLRAARAIEERLIAIIKTGKGEIKDLVAAEKELGVWRTKIEEMEGEIRYYANQVALSTLTISLAEKEIQMAAAIVVTETVTVRIEVEDVAKAHQIAMKAIEELKGRITRSELKQHTAGQFLSVLHADIPPSKKEAFVEQLKKLGIVSDFQENQRQHTEGGTGPAPALKPKQSDVRFEVTMNNTANIRPRLSADLKIATTDVPAAYQRLLDAIAKAKGQVRDGKLNEQEKLNIHAMLDFNVPASEKQGIDKLLDEIGPVLERINIRAPLNELSTASKFGYTLQLRDFASIPPRQSIAQIVAPVDVPAAYAKLQEAIIKAKGQVADAKLNEQDKSNISAQFEFTVPSEEKTAMEKTLTDLGIVLSRSNVQTPANQLATTKKFGFSVALRDFAGVPPSKAVVQVVAAIDVPATYVKIQDAVAKAKGRIADAKLNEQDKNNITAHLEFTVPSEEADATEKFLTDMGTLLSRTNVQAPANQLSTAKKFGFSLTLRDFASIPPSKAAELKVATSDVPTTYAKLLEAIAKAKGQVVDARLNEQDKFNISAQIDFSVPTDAKPALDKLIGELGTILSRNNVQAPMNNLSLAKKFGYSIVLRDFANILPSHAADIKVAANDVPGNYAKLVDAVVKAKGQIRTAKLNEQDKLNVSALLDFSVPTTEKAAIDKLIGDLGTMLSRNNVQAPLTELTTEKKFGYSVVLRDIANIPWRETFHLTLAAVDVSASFRELQEAVVAAKGLVTVGQLTEDSKVKIEARFDFDVPSSERQAIEKLFSKVGAVLGRTSSQVPVNDLATDQKIGYRLTLRSTAAIPPRDTTHVKMEVKDVDSRASDLKEMVLAAKGRIIDSNIDRHENGQVLGVLKFEVPFASQDSLLRQIKTVGTVVSQQAKRNPQVAENELTTAHIIVTLAGVTPIVPSDEGLSSYVRASLYMSFKVFSVCLMLIILGVSAVLPWALVIWVAYKVYVRMSGPRTVQLATAAGPTPPSSEAPRA